MERLLMAGKTGLRQLVGLLALLGLCSGVAAKHAPVFVECPEWVTGSHCDSVYAQVRAINQGDTCGNEPGAQSIRYHLVSGLGEIDARTGRWVWHPDPDTTSPDRFHVEIAASFGSGPMHTTSGSENCSFMVYLRDIPPRITINDQRNGSAFTLPGPGTYTFEVNVADPDLCDSDQVYVHHVEPEPAGSFTLEDDVLTFTAVANDAEKRFIVYLAYEFRGQTLFASWFFDTRSDPTPVFAICPATAEFGSCRQVELRFLAVDPDSTIPSPYGITYQLLSGPGAIYSNRKWYYHPSNDDIGQTYEIVIAAHYGDFSTTCEFSVSFVPQERGIFLVDRQCDDTVITEAGTNTRVNLYSYDSQTCTPLRPLLKVVTPTPVGRLSIRPGGQDPDGRHLLFLPSMLDRGKTFHVTLAVADASDSFSCDVYFDVPGEPEVEPFELKIAKSRNVYQGGHHLVNVDMLSAPEMLRGFDILIGYNPGALLLQAAIEGPLFYGDSCGWEYFRWRYGSYGDCDGQCPAGKVRVVGIAEMNNGPLHPNCYMPELPATLFTLDFLVSDNHLYECAYLPIRFWWLDCGDNSVAYNPTSDPTGQVIEQGISRKVIDFDLVGEVQDPTVGFPTYQGAQETCLNVEPNRPTPIRRVDFYNGGIDIFCTDPNDISGDVDLNGRPYELEDAILFASYFVLGVGVFQINPQAQIAATDINDDGIMGTVEDFVSLVRIVNGDTTLDFSTSQNPALFQTDGISHILSVQTPDTLGAVFLRYEGSVQPTLLADGIEILYNFDGQHTEVLVYSLTSGMILEGFILHADAPLVEAHTATWKGGKVTAIMGPETDIENGPDNLPSQFALHQNYPNPFNAGTKITFDLPRASMVDFELFNILGETVFQFTRQYPGGTHSYNWNGRTTDGAPVASGIYYYRLTAGEYSSTKKMLLLK